MFHQFDNLLVQKKSWMKESSVLFQSFYCSNRPIPTDSDTLNLFIILHNNLMSISSYRGDVQTQWGGSSPCETAAPEPACRPPLHFSGLFHCSIFIISEKLSPLNQLVPQLMAFVKIFKAFSENKTFQFPNPFKKSVSYFSNLAMSEEIFIVRNVL